MKIEPFDLDLVVDSDAEPCDWDAAIIEFLLRFTESADQPGGQLPQRGTAEEGEAA